MIKAWRDLRAANTLAVDPDLWEEALYHCQQGVEKVLKGFLTRHGKTFAKIHHLEMLSRPCIEIDPTLTDLLERSFRLTPHATYRRYPGDYSPLTHEQMRMGLRIAQEIFAAFCKALPPSTWEGLEPMPLFPA